jgi:excisionase family DNA binding protein
MREAEGYREQIEIISMIYPGKAALSVAETAKVLGIDRRTVSRLIQTKKLLATDISSGTKKNTYIIPVSAIAKMTTRR